MGVFLALHKLDEDNLQDVLDEIYGIQTQLENMEGVHPYHRFVSVGATNVAMESLQLWHTVSNNPDHALHRVTFSEQLDNNGFRRNLQGAGLGPSYTSMISMTDLVGFLALCPPVWILSTAISFPLYLIPIPFIGTLLSPFVYIFLVPIVLGHTLFSTAFSGTGWLFLELLSPI